MERDIARFNERITIQKNSVAIDKYQNHRNVWEDYFSCYAYASTYEAQEKESEIVTEERSIIFEVRYCSELAGVTSTGYRILFHSDVYDIESVDMMNYQRKTIKLHSRKERP